MIEHITVDGIGRVEQRRIEGDSPVGLYLKVRYLSQSLVSFLGACAGPVWSDRLRAHRLAKPRAP